MTHFIAVILTAQYQHTQVRATIQKGPKSSLLTHDLTLGLTHTSGRLCMAEMAVLTRISLDLFNVVFSLFFTLFYCTKYECQKPARNMTDLNGMACPLLILITIKSIIL
jgi:hypothetical protein